MNDIYVEGYGSVSDTVDLMKLLSFVFSETDANIEDGESESSSAIVQNAD